MNILLALKFFYSRKIAPGFKIGKELLVVDIGSGDKPFWRADVFVDKLSLGNIQRASQSETIHNLGQFVNSDASKMPFKDNAFDFSFSSHLLEHVEDPGKVIKEMMRISRAGYLEVPNGVLEVIEPFNSHLWFVFQDKGKLIFYRKTKKLHDILRLNSLRYSYLLNGVREPFIRIYWKGSISFEIVNERGKKNVFRGKKDKFIKTKRGTNTYIVIVKLLRFLFYSNKQDARIRNSYQ